jgi:hypothetical protein
MTGFTTRRDTHAIEGAEVPVGVQCADAFAVPHLADPRGDRGSVVPTWRSAG